MKFLGPPSSGSIAGTTSSHNRAGQYTRNRRSPVQPVGSGRRGFVRSALGAASAGWAALTDVQREAWTTFAAAHPITDSLGSSVVLTGQQMYVRCGTSLLNVNEDLPVDPPVNTDLPDVTGSALVVDVEGNVGWSGYSGDAADFVVFQISRWVSPGVSFMKTFWSPLTAVRFDAANAAAADWLPAVYLDEFGAPPLGSKVFGRVTPVNQYGWNGTPIVLVTTVVAAP